MASLFNITRLRHSPYYYIDFTFIKPNGMMQTLIILYVDLYTGLKIPGAFIVVNSKAKIAYEAIFTEFYRIFALNNQLPLALQSYTIDYETALENTLRKNIPNSKHVGCFFHYVQCIVIWLKITISEIKHLNNKGKK